MDIQAALRELSNQPLTHQFLAGLLKETINEEEFRKLLSEKIESVKMDFVKADISRFIKNPKALEIWYPSYFHDLSAKLKIKTSS